jgi:hypothetical protein
MHCYYLCSNKPNKNGYNHRKMPKISIKNAPKRLHATGFEPQDNLALAAIAFITSACHCANTEHAQAIQPIKSRVSPQPRANAWRTPAVHPTP